MEPSRAQERGGHGGKGEGGEEASHASGPRAFFGTYGTVFVAFGEASRNGDRFRRSPRQPPRRIACHPLGTPLPIEASSSLDRAQATSRPNTTYEFEAEVMILHHPR